MNMTRRPVSLIAALIGALLLPVTPATAETVSITPSSEITFDNTYAQTMRFDALGRAWIWNTLNNSGNPSKPRLAIFAKDGDTWTRVQTVKAKKLTVNTLRFDSSGKAFATIFRKNEIVTWRVSDAGAVRKARRVSLRGRAVPLDAFPNAAGNLFVLYRDRIVEFDLPLRSKERPIRTITGEFRRYSKLVALVDGTVFVMQGDIGNTPIEVFEPGQSGAVEPARTILIDAALAASSHASDIALTPDGNVAVAYWATGVAIYAPATFGSSVTPGTWYPQEEPIRNLQGVDFAPNGVMGIADFDEPTAVKVFFEE